MRASRSRRAKLKTILHQVVSRIQHIRYLTQDRCDVRFLAGRAEPMQRHRRRATAAETVLPQESLEVTDRLDAGRRVAAHPYEPLHHAVGLSTFLDAHSIAPRAPVIPNRLQQLPVVLTISPLRINVRRVVEPKSGWHATNVDPQLLVAGVRPFPTFGDDLLAHFAPALTDMIFAAEFDYGTHRPFYMAAGVGDCENRALEPAYTLFPACSSSPFRWHVSSTSRAVALDRNAAARHQDSTPSSTSPSEAASPARSWLLDALSAARTGPRSRALPCPAAFAPGRSDRNSLRRFGVSAAHRRPTPTLR